MATLSAAFRISAIAFLLAIAIPVYLLLQLLNRRSGEWFSMYVFRAISKFLGATVNVIGSPQMTGPCLIAANHVSWIDIVLVSGVVPGVFIAKSDVMEWPVFGTLARLKRSLFVNREKPGTTKAFKEQMKERFAANEILVLFAEGTSSDGNRVLPFKSALFSAIEESDVPVKPLSIAYTGLGGLPMGRRRRPYLAWYGDMDLLPHLWTVLKMGRFETELRFHSCKKQAELADRKKLAKYCENIVRDGLVTSLYRRPV